MTKFLSNSAGSGGSGRGDARYTAFSIDWRTAASPLHWVTRAPVTSPPGTCVTSTRQSTPTPRRGRLDPRILDFIAQSGDIAVPQRTGLDGADDVPRRPVACAIRLPGPGGRAHRPRAWHRRLAWPRQPAWRPRPAWPRQLLCLGRAFRRPQRLGLASARSASRVALGLRFCFGARAARPPWRLGGLGLCGRLGLLARPWRPAPPSRLARPWPPARLGVFRRLGGRRLRLCGGARPRGLLLGVVCARCAACSTCESTTTASMGRGCTLGGLRWAEIRAATTSPATSTPCSNTDNTTGPRVFTQELAHSTRAAAGPARAAARRPAAPDPSRNPTLAAPACCSSTMARTTVP